MLEYTLLGGSYLVVGEPDSSLGDMLEPDPEDLPEEAEYEGTGAIYEYKVLAVGYEWPLLE